MMNLIKPIKRLNKTALSITAMLALVSTLQAADCTYELFTINAKKGMNIASYVDQLSEECDLSLIVSDPVAEKKMTEKKLQKVAFKNLTINEVFDLLLIENNLNYTLEDNILRISFLETKTYNIDYILSSRKSIGSTTVMLSSQSANKNQGQQQQLASTPSAPSGGGNGAGGGNINNNPTNASGVQINSTDEMKFWEELDLELQRVLNRPEDYYQAEAPIINKNAGFITVTATVKQQKRLDSYLKELQKKVQYQVLIDVHMMAVQLNDSSETGIDWSQIYALQNFTASIDSLNIKNVADSGFVGGGAPGSLVQSTLGGAAGIASVIKISGGGSINELVKFLKTQGDIEVISNPKVLTLNNQPALITVGTEFFYKTQQSNILAGSSAGTSQTTNNDVVQSIFAGVLLDITPEISHDQTITLKINPSVSKTRIELSSEEVEQQKRSMPPDLDRRQLASVVTVKDGNRIIIGGLIDKRDAMGTNKVPLLGDIPGLGYLFKYEEKKLVSTELVIVIEPHIIKKENNTLSLAELGYSKYTNKDVGLDADTNTNANK
jgi:general secretion pathway protein D